jgi:ribosomal protein L40E
MAYYQRQKLGGAWFRVCGRCRYRNGPHAGQCHNCLVALEARPKKRRQRSLDQRLERERELLDEWLAKAFLAMTKVRYYRARVKTLDREQQRRHAEELTEARGGGIRARGMRLRDSTSETPTN